ncbi:tetratricopeptide repeat protein [Acinetobacter baumannii]|nr:tetratricopeptide repeat protein [Acinetobacter baumannii]
MLKKGVFYIGAVLMVGCTTLPDHSAPKEKTPPVSEKKKSESSSGVKITPYDHPEIQRKSLQVIVPQQKKPQRFNDDGSQLPAFKTLMQKTEQAYKNQQWSEAERYALQAQRLAPQAAETYLFLALTANHKQQYSNAESLARRGLSFAQSQAMKKQLWLVILKSGQQRNNPKTVQEAQQALKAF